MRQSTERVHRLRERRGLKLEDMILRSFSARQWQQIEKARPISCVTLLRITLFDASVESLIRRRNESFHRSQLICSWWSAQMFIKHVE
jgi:hypothetical protein